MVGNSSFLQKRMLFITHGTVLANMQSAVTSVKVRKIKRNKKDQLNG
jgi:hypothetical protein